MHRPHCMAFAILFAFASGLPLNINLGAYSPAFVVGDGEISLGSGAEASEIMGALQGAAVTTATNNAAVNAVSATTETAGNEPNALQASAIAALAAPAPTADSSQQVTSLATGAGLENDLEPRIRSRYIAEANFGEDDDNAKRSNDKRDLAGFDRALNYATTALTTSPKIELGTGEGGAGVGIIVEAGVNNGGPKAAAATAAAKRDVLPEETNKVEKRSKVTTVYIRQLPEVEERAVDDAVVKRAVETTGINLDLSNAGSLAMTFVEEV